MNKKIQVVRGIAIISVVLIHTNPTNYFGIILRSIENSFSVGVFLFLSGYLTKTQIPSIKEFYKKRLSKVFIPYIVWSGIVFLGNIVINIDNSNFIFKFLTGNTLQIYYYIFLYCIFCLITPLVIKLIDSKYSWIGWVITPLSLFVGKYFLPYFGIQYDSMWGSFLFTNWFTYYYIGLYLGNGLLKYKTNRNKTIVFFICATFLSILEGSFWCLEDNYTLATSQLKLSSFVATIFSIFLIYFYISNKSQIKYAVEKVLIKIGDYSFAIYLSHIIILNVINKIYILPFPINSIITIIVSMLFIFVSKKILGKKFSWLLGM